MTASLDKLGRSSLHYAALECDTARVLALIAAGAPIDLKDRDGRTALHFAAQSNSVDCCRALIESGASIDEVDLDGNTPLSNAVFYSHGFGDLIRYFLSVGADPEKNNLHGQSPLGLARLIANYQLLPLFDAPKKPA
jgi:ankyrin repeat protein